MHKRFDLETENKDDKEAIKSILLKGIESDFWWIILESLKLSKKNMRGPSKNALREMSAERYKFECEILEEKKKLIDNLSELPQSVIGSLGEEEGKPERLDPYSV